MITGPMAARARFSTDTRNAKVAAITLREKLSGCVEKTRPDCVVLDPSAAGGEALASLAGASPVGVSSAGLSFFASGHALTLGGSVEAFVSDTLRRFRNAKPPAPTTSSPSPLSSHHQSKPFSASSGASLAGAAVSVAVGVGLSVAAGTGSDCAGGEAIAVGNAVGGCAGLCCGSASRVGTGRDGAKVRVGPGAGTVAVGVGVGAATVGAAWVGVGEGRGACGTGPLSLSTGPCTSVPVGVGVGAGGSWKSRTDPCCATAGLASIRAIRGRVVRVFGMVSMARGAAMALLQAAAR